jgi:hypothetical protein
MEVVANRRHDFRYGAHLATMRFIATLRNGHTQFFDSQLDGRPVKFRLLQLDNEWVVVASQDRDLPQGRAVVIGETTQGSSGNPYRTDLGSGMSVAIGAVRYRFPDGTDFEGVGITPHIAIDRTVADFVSNRDSVLERARELAGVSAR